MVWSQGLVAGRHFDAPGGDEAVHECVDSLGRDDTANWQPRGSTRCAGGLWHKEKTTEIYGRLLVVGITPVLVNVVSAEWVCSREDGGHFWLA